MDKFKNIIHEFLIQGKKIESNFAKDLLSECGGEIKSSSKHEDISKHIDLWWKPDNNDKWVSFDVKGLRKNKRYNNDFSYENTWLEIKNISGMPGSLLGEEIYMAFEAKEKWIISRREVLLENLRKKINDKTIYNFNPGEDFKMYQRKDRKDLIIRVPLSFIEENSCKIIRKKY
jgi:hypothetical protein